MNIYQRQTRKIMSPKEAAEALFAKRAAPKAVAPRILDDAPKQRVEVIRRKKVPSASEGNIIDHAVLAAIAESPLVGGGSDNPPPCSGYRYLSTEVVPLEKWIRYRDNPKQRDVKARIQKGRASHLMRYDEAHCKVAIGVMPDGSIYKADGHTRAFVWLNQINDRVPETVVVDVWQCDDLAAVKSLYDKFDDVVTSETGSDAVTGAAAESGLSFESPMMRDGEISSSVKSLWIYLEKTRPKRGEAKAIINKAMKRFASELLDLDRCGPTRKKFPSCLIPAAILTIRADRLAAIHFWKNYANGLGSKVGGSLDAITVFEARRDSAIKRFTGPKRDRELMQEAAAAVRAYALNKTYTEKRGYQKLDDADLRAYANKAFGGK